MKKIIWHLSTFALLLVVIAVFFYSHLESAPVGWERVINVSRQNLQVKNLAVASRGKYIAVVYEANDPRAGHGIYVSISFDGGSTYLPSNRIADTNTMISNNPHVAISGRGQVIVVWQNHVVSDAVNRLFYSMSNDLGATWSSAEQLKLGYEMEMLPKVYFDDRNSIHLVFHAFHKNSFNLFYAQGMDGNTFKRIRSLVKMPARMRGAFFPTFSFSGSDIYLVWQGRGDNFEDSLYFMKSTNYGNSWTSPVKIGTGSGDATPSIMIYDNTLYVAFQNNYDGVLNISLLRGHNLGNKWDKNPIRISRTDSRSMFPSIALYKPGELSISWLDTREAFPTIYSAIFDVQRNEIISEAKTSERHQAKNPNAVTSVNKTVLFWEENGRVLAKYSDVHVDPPMVFSETHPEDRWSRASTAILRWRAPRDESGIVGYAVVFTRASESQRPDEIDPDVQNLPANANRMVLTGLDDGISYFHIRAIDGAGNFSRTVRYRIQTSRNPMPMPVISASIQAPGRGRDLYSARFNWTVEDRARLKGFMYSLSENAVSRPNQFTTDFNVNFRDLPPGNYFFSLSAVDKIDQMSQIVDYYLNLGDIKKLTDDLLFAQTEKRVSERVIAAPLPGLPGRRVVQRHQPWFSIELPFDVTNPHNEKSFIAKVVAENIDVSNIRGYNIVYGRDEVKNYNEINNLDGEILLTGLQTGRYTISIMANYVQERGGVEQVFWSEPVAVRFDISLPSYYPLQRYSMFIFEKMGSKNAILVTSFILSGLIVLLLGLGAKLSFYFNMIMYKLKRRVRVFN